MTKQMETPEWETLLAHAALLQTKLPAAILVGGTAAALHAGHRISFGHKPLPDRLHKPQRPGTERFEVRQHASQRRGVGTEPAGHGRGILIHRDGWDPAPFLARVIGSTQRQRQRRHAAVQLSALYRIPNYQVMTAPGVIGAAVGIRLQRAREIRQGERRHAAAGTDVGHGTMKGGQPGVQFGQQGLVQVDLVGVRIE